MLPPHTRRPFVPLMIVVAMLAPHAASAGGVVGTGTPESCTESALDAALAGGGLVTFACGAAPAEIPITTTKVLDAAEVEIDGDGRIRLAADSVPHFEVANTTTATLRALELANGSGTAGGSIANEGALTIVDCTVRDNASSANGGAIANGGTLQVTRSSFRGNAGQLGGAIANVVDGVLVIEDSELDGNTASVEGGAIYTESSSPATIRRSLLRGNSAGAAGGAIAAGASGTLVSISNTTFAQNTAPVGGALDASASVTIRSSTFSANAANGGASVSRTGGVVRFGNSILAGGTALSGGAPAGECDGSGILSDGHNLVDDDSCAFAATGDQASIAPLLGPLADNGGPTRTLLPNAGSPVIDAGDPAPTGLCLGLFIDQRGEPRTQDGDGNGSAICDIGAVEVPEPAAAAGALAAFAALASRSRRRHRV